MSHRHEHVVPQDASAKLALSTLITILFVIVETVAAIYANSLSLLGDAFHNFTDALALALSLAAVYLSRRRATRLKSYGYQRAGILAAFINGTVLVGLTVYLLVETWHRLLHPEPVATGVMLISASIGFTLNAFIALWLRGEGKSDVNVRSAVVHMFGDALSSLGIIAAALAIRVTAAPIIDAATSLLIAVLILWSSWGILRETINLLMDGTPSGIDPEAVSRDLAAQEGVYGVHHLHIWALGPSRPALSCHLMLGDVSLRSADTVLDRVNHLLLERYAIAHTTIQVEYAACPPDDPFCIPEVEDEVAHTH